MAALFYLLNPASTSRGATKECSPRRKPWVSVGTDSAPKGERIVVTQTPPDDPRSHTDPYVPGRRRKELIPARDGTG